MPNLFIIAGPNGAGKTTYVRDFLPQEMRCHEFVNAYLIAAGLSPFAPDSAAFAAGRIMLERVRHLISTRRDFSFETTLSGRAYVGLLRQARAAGYLIRLDFLWYPTSASLVSESNSACARVATTFPTTSSSAASTSASAIWFNSTGRCWTNGTSTTTPMATRICSRAKTAVGSKSPMPLALPSLNNQLTFPS